MQVQTTSAAFRRRRRTSQSGFTLIERLVAIGMIGIMPAILPAIFAAPGQS